MPLRLFVPSVFADNVGNSQPTPPVHWFCFHSISNSSALLPAKRRLASFWLKIFGLPLSL